MKILSKVELNFGKYLLPTLFFLHLKKFLSEKSQFMANTLVTSYGDMTTETLRHWEKSSLHSLQSFFLFIVRFKGLFSFLQHAWVFENANERKKLWEIWASRDHYYSCSFEKLQQFRKKKFSCFLWDRKINIRVLLNVRSLFRIFLYQKIVCLNYESA